MTVRSKTNLISYISGVIPDNNAGQISAADVRTSMIDIVDSINQIVASGDFNNETPFADNVRLTKNGNNGGMLFIGSGITFSDGTIQYVAYPGPGEITHSALKDLTVGDPHTQYLNRTGNRTMLGGLGMGSQWITSSGAGDITNNNGARGISFSKVSDVKENINVGSGTSFVFSRDNSVLDSSRGVAKAWIRFQGSGVGLDGRPTVLDAYNVSGIKKEGTGKFTVIFNSGVLKDNNYVAVGHSNGRSTTDSREDFSENTVSLAYRTGNDTSKLRSISFVVMGKPEEAGAGGYYLDGIVNDLVIFGTEPGGTSYKDSVVVNPSYTAY